MVQKIIWTVSAYEDLKDIVDFISKDSQYHGLKFHENIMERVQTLDQFPQRGRIVPEHDNPNVRELFIYRYRMIYQIVKENIIIKTIIHSAQNYKSP